MMLVVCNDKYSHALNSKDRKITIFTINDVYSINGSENMGNLARLKTLVSREKESKEIIFTINGDFIGPEPAFSKNYADGVVNILNEIGVNYWGLGNHEFDNGGDYLFKLIDKYNSYNWIYSNIKYKV